MNLSEKQRNSNCSESFTPKLPRVAISTNATNRLASMQITPVRIEYTRIALNKRVAFSKSEKCVRILI